MFDDRCWQAASYSERLRAKLYAHNISIGAMARATGINRTQFARWFNTSAEPSWKNIQRIEQALKTLIPETLQLDGSFDLAKEAGKQRRKPVHYAFVELLGGPGDGETGYTEVILPLTLEVVTKDINGTSIKATHRRSSSDIARIVTSVAIEEWTEDDGTDLDAAFDGTRPAKYVWVGESDDC